MTTATTRPSRVAAVDLIAFLVLALGIGLTAGIVLGGAVLLLAGGDPTAGQAAIGATTIAVR